jgi:hypothetical protein
MSTMGHVVRERHKVVEKYYSPAEMALLLSMSEHWIRLRCQDGTFVVRVADEIISQPIVVAGEIRIPASAINAWIAQHPYVYDSGIKARNRGELARRLRGRQIEQAEHGVEHNEPQQEES